MDETDSVAEASLVSAPSLESGPWICGDNTENEGSRRTRCTRSRKTKLDEPDSVVETSLVSAPSRESGPWICESKVDKLD